MRLPLYSTWVAALCAVSLTLTAAFAWSLSADRDQELTYAADGATIIVENGMRIVTVRGNVFIKQGSMELRGDIAVLQIDQSSSELRKVSVTGNPARFQQQPAADRSLITGNSSQIHYFVGAEELVEFIGEASFTQDGSVMNCMEIRHMMLAGTTEMTGPCTGTLPAQSN